MVEFVIALGRLMANSLEVTRRPNLFGFIKLLETSIANTFRVHCIWEYLQANFKLLSILQGAEYSLLSMCAMACIIISTFNYRKDNAAKINIPGWNKSEWQIALLTPLKSMLTSDCANEIAHNLLHIIENCGPNISREGWKIILEILEKFTTSFNFKESLSSKYSKRLDFVFKCIENICHNSLYKIHISSIESFIGIICYFTALREDLNTSLLSVSFIQNVADYMSQQQLVGNLVNTLQERISEIWISLFNRLKDIGIDDRGELRHAAYRTLNQIVEIHMKELTPRVWSYILLSLSFQLLEFVTTSYFDYPNADDKEEVKVIEERNKEDKLIKEIEESVKVLYETLVRIIRTLYSIENSISLYYSLIIIIERIRMI